jgi:Zn-dependent peptidase ImmA (M78 family)
VFVALLEADEEFDGLSCWANDSIPVIVYRNLEAGDRVRSSICHELGHLLLQVKKIDEEKAAQRFSAAFFVPRQVVFQEIGSSRQKLSLEELHQLKHKYGMSMQMWIYRARDLNIITDSHFKEWFVRFRRYGHKQEPGDAIPQERPLRYQNLIFQAFAEELIPEARAAELLGWQINEVRERMLGAFDATGG